MPDPAEGTQQAGSTFVIQEHHATALHWDFRLERDGVLVSWALPKGLPDDPERNHLAVRVEDHPLEYGTFSGTIPAGQYGAGDVAIWDRGTYDCEKWSPREVKVVLHGERAVGRYVLFPTNGKNWMIHRMDPRPIDWEPLPASIAPMLAVAGALPDDDEGWAYEFKWDGVRAVVAVEGGRIRALSRTGGDLTSSFPELRRLGESMGSTQAMFDGELVAFDQAGSPSFSRMQHRLQVTGDRAVKRLVESDPVNYVIFDLPHLDGHSLLAAAYDDRRAALDRLHLGGPRWGVTPTFSDTTGSDVLRAALEMGMEGVVAKRRSSRYLPGRRDGAWVKVKPARTQEVVIGGWTDGKGSRATGFGALLLGIPNGGTLDYVGKVGTGFTRTAIRDLLDSLRRLDRSTSPFREEPPDARGVHWVRPELVGEVHFSAWTVDGRLRHPTWRGLRSDKRPEEVSRES